MPTTSTVTGSYTNIITVSATGSEFACSYALKIAGIFGTSIIRYWPLDDAVGATTARELSVSSDSGTFIQGVTFGQIGADGKETSALFDGSACRVYIYSADWLTDFNKAEGTAMLRFKIPTAGIWTDGILRVALEIRSDGNNALHIAKNSPNNQLQCAYIAGGTSRTCQFTCSDTSWHHLALTWSQAANAWNAYLDGVLGGGLPQDIGTWSATPLDNTTNNIGQYGPWQLNWSGLIQDVIVLNRPATAAEILLASVL
jgi:hypothetical protein